MKAAAFGYLKAGSLEDALTALAERGERAKLLAGGQSLVPALNLRLMAPELLVDIAAIDTLRGISVSGGTVRIGAMTRHVELEQSADIARHVPLLSEAVRHIAHPAIRNRGTLGGSLAYADPAAELPACMVSLRAGLVVAGPRGERTIEAEHFFCGLYQTALAPDEILLRAEIPALGDGECSGFAELARRSGDYAIVGLAAQARRRDGLCEDLRLGYFAVGDRPTRAAAAAAALVGRRPTPEALGEAERALTSDLAPQDDLQASAATRLYLAKVMLRRVIAQIFPETVASRPREASA